MCGLSNTRLVEFIAMRESDAEMPLQMASIGGRPIYADRVRKIADVATDYDEQAWQPANVPAKKLFRCIESLRDIDSLLVEAGRSKSKVKLRRKIKILHTPLHSLVEATRDLANDLENNPETVAKLPENARKIIPKIRSQLLQISSIEKGGLLSITRDKISAHVDKELSAEQMHQILGQADLAQIGLWLHTCICVLSDFIKLPVYFWSCHPSGNNSIRIMFAEPFAVTLGLDTTISVTKLLDVHVMPQPPRYEIIMLFKRTVKNSGWMFSESDSRIVAFAEDAATDPWAKSLDWLPQMSGLSSGKIKPSFTKKFSTSDEKNLLIPKNVTFLVKGVTQQITDLEKLLL